MPELSLFEYVIAIAGGFLAGCINTLAGNGSAITLSILTEVLGLPGNLANGTNRVGVLFQGMAATLGFHRFKKINYRRSKLVIALTTAGAIAGVIVATKISNEAFINVFKYLMVIMLFVILIKPKRWLIQTESDKVVPLYLSFPLYLAIGFYGGFIQMGMGIFFLAILVLIAKFNIIEANAIKTLVVSCYTIIIILIFHFNGMVDWKIGGIIAIGQTFGGYLTAHYASKYKEAEIWAYRLLVMIVVLVILKLFGIISF